VSNLTTPASVQKLQTALHDKAKESPNFRFYALYDKVYRNDVLAFAYDCCKANGGVAGVDGQTFADIETYGRERWLDELAQELKSRTYQPLPVRRVHISATVLLLAQGESPGSCHSEESLTMGFAPPLSCMGPELARVLKVMTAYILRMALYWY